MDTGTSLLPFSDGGVITEGLDGLRARLVEYHALGATFAKWRAVLHPVGLHPRSVFANAHALARYAALCQDCGIVPIVEPEVIMDGAHDIDVCEAATDGGLEAVFAQLDALGVDPAGIVLKPNMVIEGTGGEERVPRNRSPSARSPSSASGCRPRCRGSRSSPAGSRTHVPARTSPRQTPPRPSARTSRGH